MAIIVIKISKFIKHIAIMNLVKLVERDRFVKTDIKFVFNQSVHMMLEWNY